MAAQTESLLYEKGYAFAIRVVKAYRFLAEERREFVLSKQFLRCGTSIGANVAEANGAISRADFSAKISIAYKECLEVKYWLSLLKDTGYIDQRSFESMFADADELAKMSFAILKSTRLNRLPTFLLWLTTLF
jgi:four helix bundle protein